MYFLETAPPRASVKQVADALTVAEIEVKAAVATACKQVDSATHDAEQTVISLSTGPSAVDAEKAPSVAVLEKMQAEAEGAHQAASASATAEVTPSGYPPVEGEGKQEGTSPLEAPMLTTLDLVPDQEDIDESPR